MIDSTCFGQYYVHHQELTTIVLITTWAVPFLGCSFWKLRAGRLDKCKSIACTPDTYPACLHLTSNQQQPKKRTAHVVINTTVVSS